jgi:hypothetical protein
MSAIFFDGYPARGFALGCTRGSHTKVDMKNVGPGNLPCDDLFLEIAVHRTLKNSDLDDSFVWRD